MTIEQHLTGAEVAGLLSVHPETIRRLAAAGELRCVVVGGVRRFPESAVTEYLEQGQSVRGRVVNLDRRRHTRPSTTRRTG